MRPDTIAKEITTPWSDKDKLEMGDSRATMLEQLDNLKTEAKASAKGYSDQKEKLEADIAATGRKYKKGYAIETVSCDIRYNDPEPGKKSLYRMDTAAHVETLDMTWEEKQDEITIQHP